MAESILKSLATRTVNMTASHHNMLASFACAIEAQLGVTVISRLRKDAALCTLPGPKRPGQRGRRRLYGEQRIDLAKRAGQRRGWQRATLVLYGERMAKRYKTFLATWRPAGGVNGYICRIPEQGA